MLSYCRLNRLITVCRFQKHILSKSTSSEVDKASKKTDISASALITNEPIVKNFFLGKISKDVVVYPEMSSNADVQALEELAQPVEKFFLQDLDSALIDRQAKIPDEVMQQLKDLGLFGQQIPLEYGGLGLGATGYARLAEVTSLDGGIAVTLAAHQAIGLKGILLVGNEQQKAKYLPRLATGELVAAFCLTEPGAGSDAQSITTKAELSPDGKHYILNGSKIYISNGGIADIMTVFCKTPTKTSSGEVKEKVSAFIVERAFGGVTHGTPEDKLGIRGSNTCEMHFENTPIPVENMLGEEGSGFKLAMNILNSGRFSMGSAGAGILKMVINSLTEHLMTRKQFGKSLSEFGLIKEKMAVLAMKVYVMESMAYMTAGLLDRFESPDLSVEAAVVKVYSSEAVNSGTYEALQMMGGQGYMRHFPYERYTRDARIMPIFEGTNEILRLFIAGNGCQHLAKEGASLSGLAKGLMAKIGLAGAKDMSAQYHPTFHPLVVRTQQQIFTFSTLALSLLSLHRKQITEQQIVLARMADCCIDFYALLCCISRASRSKSIGLRSADHELDLTVMFAKESSRRLEHNLKGLDPKFNFQLFYDAEVPRVFDYMCKSKGYAADHPLSFNWD